MPVPHPAFLLLPMLLLSSAELAAQRLLHQQLGTVAGRELGREVAAAGDLDGDGVPDFYVSEPINNQPGARVHAISGATFAPLYTMPPSPAVSIYQPEAIGDVDGDGRRDVVVAQVGTYESIQVRSGATGALIRSHGTAPAPVSAVACGVGDFDQDGRDDYLVPIYVGSTFLLAVMSGRTGAQLSVGTAWVSSSRPDYLVPVGDLTGDGQIEVVAGRRGAPPLVLNLNPSAMLRQLGTTGPASYFAGAVAVGDVDGDGRLDVAVTDPERTVPGANAAGAVLVFSAHTGALLRTLPAAAQLEVEGGTLEEPLVAIGDLDRDGAADFVVYNDWERFYALSGRTGAVLWAWRRPSGTSFSNIDLAAVGDLDADGFVDLVFGIPGQGSDHQGGWQVLSGRILATMQFLPVQCGGGPFLPQLGVTRPVLGQSVTVVGRDCPASAAGFVAMSVPPRWPFFLGVAGCEAWFDVGNWVLVHQPAPGPTWTVTLPLPGIPQLAGLWVALQAFYVPTNGPLGYDLSNGVWARLGW